MAEKDLIKKNKKHDGKEFKGKWHFVGQVKPTQKKDEVTDSWNDLPYYESKETKTKGKFRRNTQFMLETAKSNNLKIEVAGMEQKSAYPYSSKNKKSVTVAWADRLDKTKFPDDTYHIINETEWDRAETISKLIQTGQWVEVRGSYELSSFKADNGDEKTSLKRVVEQFTIIENGAEITISKEKGKDKKITYVTDFDSPDFVEVNDIIMQIGIKSTYQETEKADTDVKAVFLSNGKDRSTVNDVELTVYYKESPEGSTAKPLADAFASLNRLDFIEVIGIDNNRATFSYVDVVEELEDNDPFNEVAQDEKTTTQKRVTNGSKKGLEVVGYTAGSILRALLTEEEISKVGASKSEDPFADAANNSSEDPFADDSELPFE